MRLKITFFILEIPKPKIGELFGGKSYSRLSLLFTYITLGIIS